MGQAKRRGTFEQRQAAAIARDQAAQKALAERLAAPRAHTNAEALVALFSGKGATPILIVENDPDKKSESP